MRQQARPPPHSDSSSDEFGAELDAVLDPSDDEDGHEEEEYAWRDYDDTQIKRAISFKPIDHSAKRYKQVSPESNSYIYLPFLIVSFYKALEKVQNELSDMRNKFKNLVAHNNNLQAQLDSLKGSNSPRHGKHSSTTKKLSPLDMQLNTAAPYIKKFVALSEPFINVSGDPDFFSQPRPSLEFLKPELHFQSGRAANLKGLLASFYLSLPKTLHGLVSQHSEFALLVSSCTSYQLQLVFAINT